MKGVVACVIEDDGKVLLKGNRNHYCPEYFVDSKYILRDLKAKIKKDLNIKPKIGKLLHTHVEKGKTIFFLRINDFKGQPKNAKWFDKNKIKNIDNFHKLAIELG